MMVEGVRVEVERLASGPDAWIGEVLGLCGFERGEVGDKSSASGMVGVTARCWPTIACRCSSFTSGTGVEVLTARGLSKRLVDLERERSEAVDVEGSVLIESLMDVLVVKFSEEEVSLRSMALFYGGYDGGCM